MTTTAQKKAPLGARCRRFLTRERSKLLFLAAFVVPTLAAYIFCYVVPVFSSFYQSLFDWSGFGDMTFVGLDNFKDLFHDEVFLKSIRNDMIYVLGKELIIVPLSILFALALTRLGLRRAEVGTYRFLLYLPNVLSVSIIGIVWAFIFDPYNGIFNGILKILGLSRYIPENGWLVAHPMPCIIFVASWCGIGYFMILLVSAINSISLTLYEAAQIDGAGQWQQLWSITVPAIWDKIRYVVFSVVIGTLGNYSLVMLLAGSNGGVNGSSMVMGLYVYFYGLDSNDPHVGYANAAAIILMIISSIIILTVNRLTNREEDE